MPTPTSVNDQIAHLRKTQQYDPQEVADGLIGIADGLRDLEQKLRRAARMVRAGQYLADFAHADGRNVAYRVQELIREELP